MSELILVLAFSSIALGMLLQSLDYVFYTMLEGRFWPEFLRNFLLSGQRRKVESWKRRIRELRESGRHSDELAELVAKLIQYPLIDPKAQEHYDRFGPIYPTDFGNLLITAELYSWDKYGMDLSLFWNSMGLVLRREEMDFLDNDKTNLDMLVYSAFAFVIHLLLFSLLSFMILLMRSLQLEELLSPMVVLLQSLDPLVFQLAVPRLMVWAFVCCGYTIMSFWLLYWLTLKSALPIYNSTIKALVDATQERLIGVYSGIIRLPFTNIEERKAFWNAVRHYLVYHDIPKEGSSWIIRSNDIVLVGVKQ